MQLRFPQFLGTSPVSREPELSLARKLAQKFPTEFSGLREILDRSTEPEIEVVRKALGECLASQPHAQLASTVCGLSLQELRELVQELSKRKLNGDQRRRRAELLTRMRNQEFGFR